MRLSAARGLIPKIANPEDRKRVVRILAKTFTMDLKRQGFTKEEIFEAAMEMIDQFEKDLRKENNGNNHEEKETPT